MLTIGFQMSTPLLELGWVPISSNSWSKFSKLSHSAQGFWKEKNVCRELKAVCILFIKVVYHSRLGFFLLPVAGKKPFLRELENGYFETEILKIIKAFYRIKTSYLRRSYIECSVSHSQFVELLPLFVDCLDDLRSEDIVRLVDNTVNPNLQSRKTNW